MAHARHAATTPVLWKHLYHKFVPHQLAQAELWELTALAKIAQQEPHQIQPKELVFHQDAQHGLVVRPMVPADQIYAQAPNTLCGNPAQTREDVPIHVAHTLLPLTEDTADREIVVQPALSTMMVNAILAKLEPFSLWTEEHAKSPDAQIIPEDNRTVNATQIPAMNTKEMLESMLDMIALVDKSSKVNAPPAQLMNVVLLQIQDIVMLVFHALKFNAHTIIFWPPKDNVNHAVLVSMPIILENSAQQSHVKEVEISYKLLNMLVDSNNVHANSAHHTRSQAKMENLAYLLLVLKINTLINTGIVSHAQDIH